MGHYSVNDCSIIELDKHHSDRKGNLTVVENGSTLPFDVKRVYYIYDVPGGEARGAHAHKELEQLIVAASGSFTVVLDDGSEKKSFFLNRPYLGLYVKPGMWRDLLDFSSGSVCMVLASEEYKSEDYIRDYMYFISWREESRNRLLSSDFDMSKYGLHARLVVESDAEFILSLRTNQKLSRYIHSTSNDVEKQRAWISDYKQREKAGKEYYFIYDVDGKPLGVNRIYSIKGKVCTGGSWICRPQSDYKKAIATLLFIRDIMFETLGFEKELFDVRKENLNVLKTHKMMGATLTGESDIDYFFELDKDKYFKNRNRIISLLKL